MKKIIYNKPTGERLDVFLATELPEYSRSYFSKLIRSGNVKVNNQTTKAKQILKGGDLIIIDFIETDNQELPQAQDIDLEIIYEDQNVLVVNKPAGMVVHPAPGHYENTLVNALLKYFPKISQAVHDKNEKISISRPGLVHRLDKDTSGLIIIAKNERALHSLSRQIQNRTVKKRYVGICYGWLKSSKGTLINYLGRHPKNRKIIAEVTSEKGREAITHFSVRDQFFYNQEKATLVEFEIKTGRTHQIRVQMSIIGHPILGDEIYGNKASRNYSRKIGVKRQLLHAKSLTISLPGEPRSKCFEVEEPNDFKIILDKLKNNN